MLYVYVYFFPITLTVSLRGQPSAICYLPKKQKKQKNNALESLLPFPNPKVGLPFFGGFRFFFSLGTHPLPKLNPNQVIQNVCILYCFFFWFGGGVVARFFETLWTFFLYPLEIKEGYVVILWCAVHTEQTWPREKHTLTCKMHYLRTMVGIGLNM